VLTAVQVDLLLSYTIKAFVSAPRVSRPPKATRELPGPTGSMVAKRDVTAVARVAEAARSAL
jgi:hypothetical protein